MRKHPSPLLPLSLGLFLLAGGPVPAAEPPPVLLWIRAGDLDPAEVDPDGDITPGLRRLVLEGVAAPEIRPAGAGDPKALAAAILDASARAAIEEARNRPVADLEVRPDGAGGGEGPAGGGRWSHPAAARLEKRFGRPPPPGPAERAAVRRIRAAFGGKEAPPEPGEEKETSPGPGEKAAAVPEPEPRSLDAALRACRALENGAPVAIVLESVAAPAGARERDEALARARASLPRKGGAVLAVVALDGNPGSGGDGARASLFLAGRGVREGRIIGRQVSLAAVGTTILRIIGVPPPSGRPLEAIDAIAR